MYHDLDIIEQIHTAATYVARGVAVPIGLQEELGPELMSDIMTPEREDGQYSCNESPDTS